MSDDGFVIDFGEVPDLGPVPEGDYFASIVKSVPGKAQSGYGKIDLRFRVEDGDHEGRILFETLSWHPDALPYTKRKLIALGWEDKPGEQSIQPEDLEGISAYLTVIIDQSGKIDESTGEPYPPRNKITRISPA